MRDMLEQADPATEEFTLDREAFKTWLGKQSEFRVFCKGNPYHCPIASYLKDQYPTANYGKGIFASSTDIVFYSGFPTVKTLATPVWAVKFIREWDTDLHGEGARSALKILKRLER